MVITIENAHARQTSSELGLLSLNRVFHGPRFIRPATSGGRFPLNYSASEVQGECRGKLAWPLLSRSLHSYSHLPECEYKVNKKIDKIQVFFQFVFK
jgi:hypothetical protein